MRGYKPARILCPIRLPKDDLDKVKAKVIQDQLTFQKLVEILLNAYVKGNKAIADIVAPFADAKNAKKRGFKLDDLEVSEILTLIEEEYSPLRSVEKAVKEIDLDEEEEEEEND
mgnify:CR=1 FL=1